MNENQRWYYAVEDQTHGPVEGSELVRLIQAGIVSTSTWIVTEGTEDWSAAEESVFARYFPDPPGAVGPQDYPSGDSNFSVPSADSPPTTPHNDQAESTLVAPPPRQWSRPKRQLIIAGVLLFICAVTGARYLHENKSLSVPIVSVGRFKVYPAIGESIKSVQARFHKEFTLTGDAPSQENSLDTLSGIDVRGGNGTGIISKLSFENQRLVQISMQLPETPEPGHEIPPEALALDYIDTFTPRYHFIRITSRSWLDESGCVMIQLKDWGVLVAGKRQRGDAVRPPHRSAQDLVDEGLPYLTGNGVLKDPTRAVRLFERAAEMGNVQAQAATGTAYADGIGVSIDSERAMHWLKTAAANRSASAEVQLSRVYFQGTLVPQDTKAAFEHAKTASDLGSAGGMLMLSKMYQEGYGVAKSLPEAFRLMHKAALLGESTAMDELALMYLTGRGTAIDLVEGAAWMMLATERGVKRPEDREGAAMPEYQAQLDAIKSQGLKRASELRLLVQTPTNGTEDFYEKQTDAPTAQSNIAASPTPLRSRRQSGSRKVGAVPSASQSPFPRLAKSGNVDDIRPSPSPSSSSRLAKPGTYFLLQYVSVKTNRGIYGFEPGHEVHLVRSVPDKGTVIVSDGKCELEIAASELTNDLDVAVQLSRADAATQAQIVSRLQTEKSAAEAKQHQLDVTHSRDVEAAERQRIQNSRLGTAPNPLDQ